MAPKGDVRCGLGRELCRKRGRLLWSQSTRRIHFSVHMWGVASVQVRQTPCLLSMRNIPRSREASIEDGDRIIIERSASLPYGYAHSRPMNWLYLGRGSIWLRHGLTSEREISHQNLRLGAVLMMDGESEDISMSPRVTEVARGEARRELPCRQNDHCL